MKDTNENTNNELDNDTMVDSNDTVDNEVDVTAFAEIISDKDKRLDELEQEMSKLKKTNAELLLRVSAGNKVNDVNVDKSIIDLLDTRKVR